MISTNANGFITTVFNQSRKDDLVLLRGSPVIETVVQLPSKQQQQYSYAQKPKKEWDFFSRQTAKKEEKQREKSYQTLVSILEELKTQSEDRKLNGSSSSDKKKSYFPKLPKVIRDSKLKGAGLLLTALLAPLAIIDSFRNSKEYKDFKQKNGIITSSFLGNAIGGVAGFFSDVSMTLEKLTGGIIKGWNKEEAFTFAMEAEIAIDNMWEKTKVSLAKLIASVLNVTDAIVDGWGFVGEKASTITENLAIEFPNVAKAMSNTSLVVGGIFDAMMKRIGEMTDELMRQKTEEEKKLMNLQKTRKELEGKLKSKKYDLLKDEGGNWIFKLKNKYLNGGVDELKKEIKETERELEKIRLEEYKQSSEAIKKGALEGAGKVKETAEKLVESVLNEKEKKIIAQSTENNKKIIEIEKLQKIVEALNSSLPHAQTQEGVNVIMENLEKVKAKLKELNQDVVIGVELNLEDAISNIKELKTKKIFLSDEHKKVWREKVEIADSYYDRLGKTETGGYKDPYKVVNRYGYTGKYQFGKDTAKPYLKSIGAKWKDFKGDEALQEVVVRMFTEDNKKGLLDRGMELSDFNLWVAHNLGLGGVDEVLLHKDRLPDKGTAHRIRQQLPPSIKNKVPLEDLKQTYINRYAKKFDTDSYFSRFGNDQDLLKEVVQELKLANKIKGDDNIIFEFVDDTTYQGII